MLKKIENFLNKNEIEILSQYWKLSKKNMKPCPQSIGSIKKYKDILSDSILLVKKPLLESIVGEPLLATYSYSRMYFNGTELLKHNDRPSCEITATVNIYADKDWKIFFTPAGSNKKPLGLMTKPGEALLYEGRKYDHWREKYEAQECMQIFLHYVRENGPYKSFYESEKAKIGD